MVGSESVGVSVTLTHVLIGALKPGTRILATVTAELNEGSWRRSGRREIEPTGAGLQALFYLRAS